MCPIYLTKLISAIAFKDTALRKEKMQNESMIGSINIDGLKATSETKYNT